MLQRIAGDCAWVRALDARARARCGLHYYADDLGKRANLSISLDYKIM